MRLFNAEEVVGGDRARCDRLLRGSNRTCQEHDCEETREAKLHLDDSVEMEMKKTSRSLSQPVRGPRRRETSRDAPAGRQRRIRNETSSTEVRVADSRNFSRSLI